MTTEITLEPDTEPDAKALAAMATGPTFLRIQEMSDLHVEFDRDGGAEILAQMMPANRADPAEFPDVLILAGDIGMGDSAIRFVGKTCSQFYPTPVLWVPGNHEYYREVPLRMGDRMRILEKQTKNLTLLDRATKEIHGQRFIGCTLWYKDPLRYNWSDYKYIKNFPEWVNREAQFCRSFLEQELRPGDIVVTHMLPSEKVVSEKWKGNDDNRFFVHELGPLIAERKPALWFFGHTHEPADLTLHSTRMVCNPRAYPFEEGSKTFDARKMLIWPPPRPAEPAAEPAAAP